ncbi:hemolysin XhlA family protein [Clostridium sp. Mt-5]|uniref:Hemolysin XhlA family protein n=1 Tax=Clostridium moutaii TaxID=3240932 RepID=A0ABV4BS70_9CLOT
MSECYDAKLDEEKHEHIKEKLKKHDNVLDEHDTRLKKLENRSERVDERLGDLCDRLGSLTSVLMWSAGLIGASFLGLFIYLLEQHLK